MYRAARRLGVLFGAALLLVLQSFTLGPMPRGGLELDLAAPGVAEFELRGVFGDPLVVEQDPATKTWREDFARPDAGFARLTVWLDRQERVTCARVRPVRPLRLAAAELLFDLRGASTRSAGHLFSGVDQGII